MDAHRFDSLIRLLADPRSRRGVLGGALGVLAGLLAVPEAEGKRKRHRGHASRRAKNEGKSKGKKKNTKRTICHCPPGNAQNCQTLTVGAKAARAHLKHHPNDRNGACAPPVCEGPCDDQQTCTALGETCVCRTLQGTCGACLQDSELAGGVAECCSDVFCERDGT